MLAPLLGLACTFVSTDELKARLDAAESSLEGSDQDGDGFAVPIDCWDDPSTLPADRVALNGLPQLPASEVYPGAADVPYDGIDADCAEDGDFDVDGDGWSTGDLPGRDGSVGEDCDDADAALSPSAAELCNGVDDDCSGAIDDGAPGGPYYADIDGDGYGDPAGEAEVCAAPAGYVDSDTDCDDADAAVSPVGVETCDGRDEDCDGAVDEDGIGASLWYTDDDGDGFGDASSSVTACAAPAGTVADASDCDDTDYYTSPEGLEVCGGGDEDCDGTADESSALDAPTWYADADGDGYGGSGGVAQCSDPGGMVQQSGDCDERSATVNPGAPELCNGGDDDCDGTTDEDDASDASIWYLDADADGHGLAANSYAACALPAGYAALDDDCDDGDPGAYPGAVEICGGGDEDCDGDTDEADATGLATWYLDADLDGAGDPDAVAESCAQPTGYVATGDDCDDEDPSVGPLATESCNSQDDDCDGEIDESEAIDAEAWYADLDGDSYGDPDADSLGCTAPAGHVADDTDCDDAVASIHPGATESCGDGLDDDCDGRLGQCRFDPALDLADADAIYAGSEVGEQAGSAVAAIPGLGNSGDLLLAIGGPGYDGGEGVLWLVDPTSPSAILSTTSAYRITGTSTASSGDGALGTTVAAAGDINNDGDADLVIGSPAGIYNSEVTGISQLMFGPIGVSTTTGSAALHYYGEGPDAEAGAAVGGGDLDTDTRDELLVGAPGESTGGAQAGTLYVIDYAGTGWRSLADAATRIDGQVDERLGAAFAAVDLDGDGLDDLVVGAPGASAAAPGGSVRLYLGPLSGSYVAADADDTWETTATAASFGTALAGIPDCDGDGRPEVLLGAPEDPSEAAGAGSASLLAWSGALVEESVLSGEDADGKLGGSVASAGDVDGDGLPDLLVGSGAGSLGQAWLVYGPPPAALVAEDADVVFSPSGEAAADLSASVAGAGDTDGDGFDDLVIGAATASEATLDTNGAAYLFRGTGD